MWIIECRANTDSDVNKDWSEMEFSPQTFDEVNEHLQRLNSSFEADGYQFRAIYRVEPLSDLPLDRIRVREELL